MVKGSALHEGLTSLQPDHGWLTWFRVYSVRLFRPIQTRFPYGSGCLCLNLATHSNSLAHSPKGTPSHVLYPFRYNIVLRPLVGARFQILFHSPHRGSFHLSLTVLVRYRSSRVFSLGQWSALLPTRFLVSRGTQDPNRSATPFADRAFTVSG